MEGKKTVIIIQMKLKKQPIISKKSIGSIVNIQCTVIKYNMINEYNLKKIQTIKYKYKYNLKLRYIFIVRTHILFDALYRIK